MAQASRLKAVKRPLSNPEAIQPVYDELIERYGTEQVRPLPDRKLSLQLVRQRDLNSIPVWRDWSKRRFIRLVELIMPNSFTESVVSTHVTEAKMVSIARTRFLYLLVEPTPETQNEHQVLADLVGLHGVERADMRFKFQVGVAEVDPYVSPNYLERLARASRQPLHFDYGAVDVSNLNVPE